jgi:hypothetical protein
VILSVNEQKPFPTFHGNGYCPVMADSVCTIRHKPGDTPKRMNGINLMKTPLLILGLGLAGTLAAEATDLAINSFDATGRLTFAEVPRAATYRVEWTTNLLSAAWSSNAPGIPVIPSLGGGNLTVTVGVVHASCYYRVVATLTNGPATSIATTFNLDSENWLIVSYPFRSHAQNPPTSPLPYDGTFGNPSGSVRVGDVYGETGVAAPMQYLGDKLAYYGGRFAYDIFLRYTDAVTYPAVVLNSGTLSLYYDAPSPPLSAWQRSDVPLSEAGWKVSGTGAKATEAVFKSVLSSLTGLYIYTEWNTGTDDTNVDNITLTPP